jgi:4-amino-4-deoxy-L-arabinose transferase-like glycosyltransferase
MRRWQSAALLAIVAAATAFLYFYRLDSATPYLASEERTHARQSVILAATGKNEVGQSYPLYFPEGDYLPGRDPAWVYIGAAMVKLGRFSAGLVRSPSAAAGVANVVLMFLVAGELFGSTPMALTAAILLALTPAHFIQSRIATSQISTVTSTLAWLLFLLRYLNRKRRRDLFLATFSLGVGAYVYLGVFISAPVLFILTLVVTTRREQRAFVAPALIAACAGIGLAVMPLIVWHALHLERIAQILTYYNNRDRADTFAWRNAITHLDTWWIAYNPDRLFFTGDQDYRFSTRTAGYFLLPLAFLMPAGLWSIRRVISTRPWVVVCAGLVLTPLPAVVGGNGDFKHWLMFLPFAICVATAGAHWVVAGGRRAVQWGSLALLPIFRWVTPWPSSLLIAAVCAALWSLAGRRRAGLAVAAMLALVGGVQSASFFDYYFRIYGSDTSENFGGNLPGAIREALAVTGPRDCIRFDRSIYDVEGAWVLYAWAYNRRELVDRPNGLGPDGQGAWDPSCPGATVLTVATDTRFADWQSIPIPELRGPNRLVVHHRLLQ